MNFFGHHGLGLCISWIDSSYPLITVQTLCHLLQEIDTNENILPQFGSIRTVKLDEWGMTSGAQAFRMDGLFLYAKSSLQH